MAENKEYDPDDIDPLGEAMSYGTVWTTSMFEHNNAPYKITRSGMSWRIPRQLPWWGIPGAAIGGFIGWLIFIKILNGGMLIYPIVITLALVFGVVFTMIGSWSPMRKDTGEDLKTYIILKLRKKVATRKTPTGEKPSSAYYNSLAVGDPQVGRVVKCQMWLGTQPLSTAAPKDPFYKGVYRTPYVMKKSGDFIPLDPTRIDDGLGTGINN